MKDDRDITSKVEGDYLHYEHINSNLIDDYPSTCCGIQSHRLYSFVFKTANQALKNSTLEASANVIYNSRSFDTFSSSEADAVSFLLLTLHKIDDDNSAGKVESKCNHSYV